VVRNYNDPKADFRGEGFVACVLLMVAYEADADFC
jgi:hypothetical protein